MNKRRMLALLVSSLFLAAGPLAGCGETDDPTANGEEQNETTNQTNNETTNQTNNETTNQTNNDDPECTISDDCEGEQVCSDTGTCEEPEPFEPETCEDEGWFYGQITDDENTDYAGGIPTTDPLTEGSGLADVWAELDAAWDPDSEDPIEVTFDEPIPVEATVIATSFSGERRLFLQDQDESMYLLRLSAEDPVPTEPHVGQRVSFDALAANIFFGDPQIRDFDKWQVIETPEEEQFVPYVEVGDAELTKEEHYYKNVRVVGWLSDREDDTWECGSDQCYRMFYGSEGQNEVTFKTGSSFIEGGNCVTFVGPAFTFPGYYEEDAEIQLDTENFDWVYATGGGGLDD